MTSYKHKKILSNRKARKKYKKYYNLPKLPSNIHVHHLDGNPFNNDINNLWALEQAEHLRLHSIINKPKVANRRLKKLSKELVSLTYLMNNGFYFGAIFNN